MTSPAVLRVDELEMAFSRRGRRAVAEVSFELRRGEILALVGESGSGKTTVARMLARLLRPSGGRILLDGRDVLREEPRRASRSYRGRLQMVFQDPFASLNPVHTVAHHIERPLWRHRKVRTRSAAHAAARGLLAAVGLTPPDDFAGRRPDELSGGQRQRVALARALAVEPEILIADEPTSMLDASMRAGVLGLIQELAHERGVAVLTITHDLASARRIADRTMVMYAGRVVEVAPTESLVCSPAHPYTRLLLAAAPRPGGTILRELPVRPGQRIHPSPACSFASRCPDAVATCFAAEPADREVGPGHRTRCHLAGSISEETCSCDE